MTSGTYGLESRAPLAYYDRGSSCWRMSQGMFPSDFPTSSETWPPSGTTRRGLLFELPTPALPIIGRDSSSSLFPTPLADNSRGLPQTGTAYQSLPNVAVALFPTPLTTDSTQMTPSDLRRNTPQLRAVSAYLPTPLASDGDKGGPNQRGGSGDLRLSSAAVRIGARTAPRSDDGSASWDVPLPFP